LDGGLTKDHLSPIVYFGLVFDKMINVNKGVVVMIVWYW